MLRRRSEPMPVKYWSSAGIILTYGCNASCASCYLQCGPGRRDERMNADFAVEIWRQLIAASPIGCRVHLTGGEPFIEYELLAEVCGRAHREGLGPLEKIETNAFWATDEKIVRDRLRELSAAGMKKLAISADPYHQQFVPMENCRLAARIAEEVLGPGGVLVRWRDWLQNGFDTAGIPESQRRELFLDDSSIGRERFNGRAAELLAPQLVDRGREGSVLQSDSSASWGLPPNHAKKCKPKGEFADNCCREALLRSRHVHVDPLGRIVPGTCAGIVLGVVKNGVTVADVWRRLNEDWACRPVVGSLVRGGPVALLEESLKSSKMEYSSDEYAGKCHLCWQTRRLLASLGRYPLELPIGNDAGKKSSKVDA